MIKDVLQSSTSEQKLFLSILQNLLCLRDDAYSRPAYYEMIENIISQIVLCEAGQDPDFNSKNRIQFDVESYERHLINIRQLKEDIGVTSPSRASTTSAIDDLIPDPLPPNPTPPTPPGGGLPPPPPPPPPPGCLPPPPPGFPPATLTILPKRVDWPNRNTKPIPWPTINPSKLDSDSFWMHINEDVLLTDDLIDDIANTFKVQDPPKNTPILESKPPRTFKKSLLIMEEPKERSLLISLARYSKNKTYAHIRNSILTCDLDTLNEDFLRSLINNMPPDETMRLEREKQSNSFHDLVKVDQFCLTVADIERLLPRLKCLLFKHRYPQLIQDSKQALSNAIIACKEVRGSPKFGKLLEYILLIGNITNAGSNKSNAIGFGISYLPKVI